MTTNEALNLARGLSLPIEVAGQAVVILGIRGSGKTNTSGVIAEELLDHGKPIAVIDPTDAWWGLRSGRDGKPDGGYQVFIFGGPHGDIPLQETDGQVIAEFVARERVSVILSLRHLRKAAQRRFVTEFCEELYHLKGQPDNRTPLTVFIDEAPLFVPAKVMGEVARTVGAVEDLIARGRVSGFGVVLVSQRSATLNADVRTQADTMICHRVVAKLDRKAIEDWFEENASVEDLKAILKSLATLKNGEAWIWAPSLDIMQQAQMRIRRTFDSSATPKMGQTVNSPKQLADIDLGKLQKKMLVAAEERKANDPKELRATIETLRRELAEKVVAKGAKVDPDAIKKAFEKGVESAKKQMAKDVRSSFGPLVKMVRSFAERAGDLLPAEAEWNFDSVVVMDEVLAPPPTRTPTFQPPARPNYGLEQGSVRETTTGGGGEKLPGASQKILDAMADLLAIGLDRPPRVQVAFMAGYTNLKSKGLVNSMGALRTAGYIDYPNAETVSLSDPGRAQAHPSYTPRTSEDLQQRIIQMLGGTHGRILQELIHVYPDPLGREELASRCNYSNLKSKGFGNAIGRLRTLGFVDYPDSGTAIATRMLFL